MREAAEAISEAKATPRAARSAEVETFMASVHPSDTSV